MTLLQRAARFALLPAMAALAPGCGLLGGAGPHVAEPTAGTADDLPQLAAKAANDSSQAYWPFRIAEIQAERGHVAEADSALDEALRRDPSHAPSLSLRSRLWFDAGRHDDAIALLEDAARRRPLPEALQVELALHYEAAGRADDAARLEASLEKTLQDWAGSGAALTYLRLRGDDFATCQDVARRALDARPSAVNHNNYGIALLYAGKPLEARTHFEEAARLDPALPGPLYNLAIVDQFYRFDSAAARRWFDRYRELASDDPDGLAKALTNELAGTPDSAEVTP
jgi:tetratricopeptide (TPR) repeat protein